MSYKILVVDDALFMRNMIKDIFTDKKIFMIVGEAENGLEAIDKFKDLKPDIVTMDIVMPELDGISATKKILELDKNAKIVMCSALGQEQLVMEAIEAGAKDFIVKPFQPTKALHIIKNILGIRE